MSISGLLSVIYKGPQSTGGYGDFGSNHWQDYHDPIRSFHLHRSSMYSSEVRRKGTTLPMWVLYLLQRSIRLAWRHGEYSTLFLALLHCKVIVNVYAIDTIESPSSAAKERRRSLAAISTLGCSNSKTFKIFARRLMMFLYTSLWPCTITIAFSIAAKATVLGLRSMK